MAAILQTTFSNFSWTKMYEFWFRFQWMKPISLIAWCFNLGAVRSNLTGCLKFVLTVRVQIDNMPALVQITALVWEWISNFIPHFTVCDYLSMLGLKLNHVSERGPWCLQSKGRPAKQCHAKKSQLLTCRIVLKIMKYIFLFRIIFWLCSHPSRWN